MYVRISVRIPVGPVDFRSEVCISNRKSRFLIGNLEIRSEIQFSDFHSFFSFENKVKREKIILFVFELHSETTEVLRLLSFSLRTVS